MMNIQLLAFVVVPLAALGVGGALALWARYAADELPHLARGYRGRAQREPR